MIYSLALVRSYKIEKQIAIVPRIVIDDNAYLSLKSRDIKSLEEGIITSMNGVYFIDTIDDNNYGEIYKYAKTRYLSDYTILKNNQSAFLKHLYFHEYIRLKTPENLSFIPYIKLNA